MEFKKYSSIENSYREPFIDLVRGTLDFFGEKDMLFSVSEKVDGCNVSIITDGNEIITGKRSSVLGADEKFYGFQDYAESIKDKVVAVFNNIKEIEDKEVVQVQIFGEFFGGSYKGIPSKETKIQKGIDYSPNHEFYAFDIFVTYADGTSRYLNVDECAALFIHFKFFYNVELFRGTLDEALGYNPVFISTIGQRLGLPVIEGNFAEGVVIRPVEELRFANGERVIIKNKNPKFNEFEKKEKKPDVVHSDSCNTLKEAVKDYITEARLGNVVSHIGEIEMPKQMGLLIKEFSADVIEEFTKDHPEYLELESNEQKVVNKVINAEAVNLIKTKF